MALPLAAKAVVTVLTDKRLRMIALSVVAGVVTAVVLPIVLIIHILTMPFAGLTALFSPDELEEIAAARADFGFDQYLDPAGADYLLGNGVSYEGVTFADGVTSVTYYAQFDSRWADTPYGVTGTIGRSGCGPTALAIAVSSLTGTAVDPVQTAKWSSDNGCYLEGSGSYRSLIPNGARHFGLTAESVTAADAQKIVDALSAGKLVVAIMVNGHFTKSGHFIVLRGVTAEGKILVADPASASRSGQEWDLSIILGEAGNARDEPESGPFWILSS
ncbi:MAG: C39 family peptidase [Oscillospiraceae bacterium]|nr:C39 family peptidase [Oscillospiraceae bacterium]